MPEHSGVFKFKTQCAVFEVGRPACDGTVGSSSAGVFRAIEKLEEVVAASTLRGFPSTVNRKSHHHRHHRRQAAYVAGPSKRRYKRVERAMWKSGTSELT